MNKAYRQFLASRRTQNYKEMRVGYSVEPSFETLINWVLSSWKDFSSETIKQSFATCGINPNDYAFNIDAYHSKLNKHLGNLLLKKSLPVSYIDFMMDDETVAPLVRIVNDSNQEINPHYSKSIFKIDDKSLKIDLFKFLFELITSGKIIKMIASSKNCSATR